MVILHGKQGLLCDKYTSYIWPLVILMMIITGVIVIMTDVIHVISFTILAPTTYQLFSRQILKELSSSSKATKS